MSVSRRRRGAPGELALGVGDLEITALVDVAKIPGAPGSGLAGLTFRASGFVHGVANVDADAQKLRFEPNGVTVELEPAASDDPEPAAALTPRLELFLAAWLPLLARDLVGSIAFPLFPLDPLPGYALGVTGATVDRLGTGSPASSAPSRPSPSAATAS